MSKDDKGSLNLSIVENKADLAIVGVIGWEVWDTDVMWMLAQLQDVTNMEVDLDSLGGSVLDGVTIHNLLKSHQAKITINIIGKAVSMGSVIAMAGDHVTMMSMGVFMLHNPWVSASGESKDMKRTVNQLDMLKSTLITAYANKSGLSREVLSKMMDDETWLTPQQALEHGFIDEVIETSSDIAAHFIPNNQTFNNVPAFAQDLIKKETPNMSTENQTEAPKAPATQDKPPVVNTPAPEQPKAEAPKAEAPKAEAPKTEAPKADVVNRCPADVQNIADMTTTIMNLTEKNNTLQETVLEKDSQILNITADKDTAVATAVKAQLLANKIGSNLADVEVEDVDPSEDPRKIWKNMPNNTADEREARAIYFSKNIKKKN